METSKVRKARNANDWILEQLLKDDEYDLLTGMLC